MHLKGSQSLLRIIKLSVMHYSAFIENFLWLTDTTNTIFLHTAPVKCTKIRGIGACSVGHRKLQELNGLASPEQDVLESLQERTKHCLCCHSLLFIKHLKKLYLHTAKAIFIPPRALFTLAGLLMEMVLLVN